MNPPGFTPPPCPECAAPLDIDWLDVTRLGSRDPEYMPGQMRCPANPHHKVSAAYAELSWPPDLTADDKAWLRTQHGIAS